MLDVTPAERRADPDFDGRAYALAAASVKALEAIGVWRAVADKAQAMREMVTFQVQRRHRQGIRGDIGGVDLRLGERTQPPFVTDGDEGELGRAVVGDDAQPARAGALAQRLVGQFQGAGRRPAVRFLYSACQGMPYV